MGPRLVHTTIVLVVMLGGCSHRLTVPTEQPLSQSTDSKPVVTPIPEPPASPAPYADAQGEVRQVAEAFVRGVLEYDARTESVITFMSRVARLTTATELRRLRDCPRARLPWRVLRDRAERVAVAVTGVSVAANGRVLVRVERTTTTTFATVRDFLEVSLELSGADGSLKVENAGGGEL